MVETVPVGKGKGKVEWEESQVARERNLKERKERMVLEARRSAFLPCVFSRRRSRSEYITRS